MQDNNYKIRKLRLEALLASTDGAVRTQLRYICLDCKDGLEYVPFDEYAVHSKDKSLPLDGYTPKPGDILYDGSTDTISSFTPKTYGIKMPSKKIIYEFLKRFQESSSSKGLRRFFDAVDFVYSFIPYARYVVSSGEDERDFFTALDIFYSNKIFRLEDFIKRNIPAICFSKAAALATIINYDSVFKGYGAKAKIVAGFYKGGKSGLHGWVRLDLPQITRSSEFLYDTYILDPTFNEICVNSNCLNKEAKNKNAVFTLDPKTGQLIDERVFYIPLGNGEYNLESRRICINTGILRKQKSKQL